MSLIKTKGKDMKQQSAIQTIPKGCAQAEAADLVTVFLLAWEEAVSSYEHLLAKGLSPDDLELANDLTYARLLRAGQSIHWIGGESALGSAARLIARQVPDGSLQHFNRLWCGLLPKPKVLISNQN